MKRIYLFTILLSFVVLSFTQAQVHNIVLTVNGDAVKNNDVYNYYPTFLELNITKGDRLYKVNKGKITLARGKNIQQVITFDTNYIAKEYGAISSKIKAGDKVIVDLLEIEEYPVYRTFQDSVQVDDSTWVLKDTIKMINAPIVPVKFTNRFIMFTLSGAPKIKLDPNCAVLVNKSNAYVRQGIKTDTIKTVEFLLAQPLKDQPLKLTLVRPGTETTAPVVLKSYNEFAAKSKQIFKFALPGDVLQFEIKKSGEKTCNVAMAIF